MKLKLILAAVLMAVAGMTAKAEVTWPTVAAQEWTVTLGDKVTSANAVEDGGYYILYNPRNKYCMYEASDNKLLLSGGSAYSDINGTTTSNAIFKLIANGDGTYKIQSATGRYLPAPTANGNISTAETPGNYALNFQTLGSIYPRCTNEGETYGLDHTSSGVYALTPFNTTSGSAQEYHLYKVTLTASDAPTSVTELTTGWYRIKCIASTGKYTGYLKNASPETVYGSANYPIGIQSKPAGVNTDDATYYVHLTKSADGHYIKVADGHYIDKEEPKSIMGVSSCKILSDYDGFYFQANSNSKKYFVPYDISKVPSIGGSTQDWAPNVRYALYPVSPESQGLAIWTVTITDGTTTASPLSGNTTVTCSNEAVKGISTVYDGGNLFFPSGIVPSSSDFAIGNDENKWKFVIDSSAKTITASKVADNELTSLAELTTGWYQIVASSPSDDEGRYWYNNAEWQRATNEAYAIYGQATTSKPADNDATYFIRIEENSGQYYLQSANGHYVDTKMMTTTTPTAVRITYDDTKGAFKLGNHWKYMTLTGSNVTHGIIGYTGTDNGSRERLLAVNLTAAELTPWKIIFDGMEDFTTIACTRNDVNGLTTVYDGGYIFLPSDAAGPATGEFNATVNAATVYPSATIDTDAHTITLSFPTLTITSPFDEATFTWNGQSKTGKSVTFYNYGATIADNTISVTYSGVEYTAPVLSQTTWDGTTNASVTCTLTPAFFSSTYGEKWVRIGNAKNTAIVMSISNGNSGEQVKAQALDYFDEGQLWCFVGNATSYKIYNKKAGETLQMASGNTSITASVYAVLAAANADGTDWKFMDNFSMSDGPGWGICYANYNGTDLSLNPKGGVAAGKDIGYYTNGDGNGGSRWLIADASSEIALTPNGLTTSTMTTYTHNIAYLTVTIDCTSSRTLMTKDNFTTMTGYVPTGAEITFATPALFQNYSFTGYNNGNSQSVTFTASSEPQTVTATFTEARSEARYLWEPLRINGNEPDYYRIPAIVTAKNGDILAINDRRYNNATDLGNNGTQHHHIDIIGVASSDNGATWSEEFIVMDDPNDGVNDYGYGDAAVVADRERNEVLVMACGGNIFYTKQTLGNHQTIHRTVLTHNGSKWEASGIENVTSQFYAGELSTCVGMFIGSGAISQSRKIKKGDYYRVYCAVLARDSKNYAFYSDDFGKTWTLMGSVAANDNEAKIDELPDGNVLLSVRTSGGRLFNVWTWSDNTYTEGAWGTAVKTQSQTEGISFGGNSTNGDIRMIPAIKKATGEQVVLAMQSVPTGSGRSNVALFYKEMDPNGTYTDPTTVAQNWSNKYQVTSNPSAYSTFNPQPDGRIAFYMEESPITVNEALTGYYLCYLPLTIDEITNNLYTGIASTYPVSLNQVGSKYYSTLYLPFDVTTDSGTEAYYISQVNGSSATLTPVTGGEIAANTAVVLVSEDSGTATLNVTTGLTQQVSESANLLKGTLCSRPLDLSDDNGNYAMGVLDGNIGFYKFDDGQGNANSTVITLGANKAYLQASGATADVKGFTLSFRGEDGIKNVAGAALDATSSERAIYSLSGQRLSRPVKGINIIGGKKVVVR